MYPDNIRCFKCLRIFPEYINDSHDTDKCGDLSDTKKCLKAYLNEDAKNMALFVNGGDWDKDYIPPQKAGWQLKAFWAYMHHLELMERKTKDA